MDAILSLVSEYNFVADDVESIRCEIPPLVDTCLIYTNPDNTEHARFSLEACVAMALCEGNLNNSVFTEQKIAAPGLRTVMKRVQRHVRDDFNSGQKIDSPQPKEAARLIVHLTDNRRLEKTVLFAKGNNENPLSGTELETKFKGLAHGYLSDDTSATFRQMVLDLESLKEVNILTDYL